MFFYIYKIAVRASLEVSDVADELAQPKKLKKLQVLWYLSHANILLWQQVFHGALFFSLSMTLDSFLMSSLNNFQNYLAGWEILSDTQSSHMPAVDPSVLLGTGYPTWTGVRWKLQPTVWEDSQTNVQQHWNRTDLSYITCKSQFKLLAPMKWLKAGGLRTQLHNVNTMPHKQNRWQRILQCMFSPFFVQQCCLISFMSFNSSLISSKLHFSISILLYFHYRYLDKTSSKILTNWFQ